MKKLTVLIILITVLVLTNNSYSQLPNQGTYLLKNLNQHTLNNYLYSAIWGYVAPNGREYALLGCPNGTAFIDVTDSANIREVDFVTGPNNNWREMKTYSHYAYVVSEANNSRLQIIDLQYLPDSVSLVKTWFYTGYSRTHSISQSGHYLYLNGGNSAANGGITILDVIDPVNPVKLGQWTTSYVHDCRVVNDTIYAANIEDGEVSIISATNKNAPSTVRIFSNLPGSGPHNTALTDNRKRLFVTDEIGTAPFRLKVWNIEDLNNITFVTAWQPTGITNSIVHNIETYGNIAVVAHYSAGIRILNISNPDVPQEIAWYDTYPSNNNESYNGCWGVYMFPSGKIAASDRQTGFYLIKSNIPLTGISGNISVSTPENFKLGQNYPNPFNPSTKINFSLPEHSKASLKIYDINGREVAQLFNDTRDAGNYEVNFEADRYGLSSGVYFYSLTTQNFSE
ncbi:MAG TPA: choice-of-anchor B family protein, partial [Ignavibacteria bacterium]|nr:choice-of-anchor B family protein [Ignavibacteria bacterium]